MLQQYCDRVARYSTAGYSVVIRNIIHYINLHLKEDLTRIQFAANLLRYHRYTITQAAQEVGIQDVLYFTLLFKRTIGETLSHYAR